MYERFEELLDKHGVTTYKVAKDTGIAQTTFSAWKKGKSTPKTNTMQKIAEYFGVTVDWLTGGSKYKNDEEVISNWAALDKIACNDAIENNLDEDDEADIVIAMKSLIEQLNNQDALMFDGEPLDDESRELFKASLENSLRMGKMLSKNKKPTSD